MRRVIIGLMMVAIVSVAAMAMAQTAEEWLDKAIEYRKMSDWEKAIEATHKALEIEPNNKYAHANLGWYYDELDDHETAVDHCNKAIDMDESFVPGLQQPRMVLLPDRRLHEGPGRCN